MPVFSTIGEGYYYGKTLRYLKSDYPLLVERVGVSERVDRYGGRWPWLAEPSSSAGFPSVFTLLKNIPCLGSAPGIDELLLSDRLSTPGTGKAIKSGQHHNFYLFAFLSIIIDLFTAQN